MRLGPKRVPAIPRPIKSGQIMNRTEMSEIHPLTEMRNNTKFIKHWIQSELNFIKYVFIRSN
jgi:hypothetical protein